MTLPSAATKNFLDDGSSDTPAQALAELEALVDKLNAIRTHLLGSTLTSGSSVLGIGDGLESSAGSLRAKLDGATLARSASGLKLADNAVNLAQLAHQAGLGLLVYLPDGTPAFLAAGDEGQVLAVNEGSPTGVGWKDAGGGGVENLGTVIGDGTSTDLLAHSLPDGYDEFILVGSGLAVSSASSQMSLNFSNDDGSTIFDTNENSVARLSWGVAAGPSTSPYSGISKTWTQGHVGVNLAPVSNAATNAPPSSFYCRIRGAKGTTLPLSIDGYISGHRTNTDEFTLDFKNLRSEPADEFNYVELQSVAANRWWLATSRLQLFGIKHG